jgi:hypothetical protein
MDFINPHPVVKVLIRLQHKGPDSYRIQITNTVLNILVFAVAISGLVGN